ncbi:hypothetical protein B0H13DRAFT_1131610 [Mycena leptocephala]|nr:hypothetical protein B0H13DRAFT_1131610 [Mycena leptocephala]
MTRLFHLYFFTFCSVASLNRTLSFYVHTAKISKNSTQSSALNVYLNPRHLPLYPHLFLSQATNLPLAPRTHLSVTAHGLREGLLKNITSSQVELSKLIGKQWGAMTAAQKRPFVVKARELKAARITALELGSLNVGGHSSNHRVPCEVKTKSTSNSRNENRLLQISGPHFTIV